MIVDFFGAIILLFRTVFKGSWIMSNKFSLKLFGLKCRLGNNLIFWFVVPIGYIIFFK